MPGLPEIEHDHQQMGEAIERIGSLCVKHDKVEVIGALADLEILSREHFAREEDLMRSSGYSLTYEHTQKHWVLLRFLSNLIEMVRSDSLRCDLTVVQILRDWKNNHIETTDADYFEFARGRRTLDLEV